MRVINGNFRPLVSPTTSTPHTTSRTSMPTGGDDDGQVGDQGELGAGQGEDEPQWEGVQQGGDEDGLSQEMVAVEEEIHEEGEEGREGVGLAVPPTVTRQERESSMN